MQAPVWVSRVARVDTAPGLLIATSVTTAVFVATPVALRDVADRFSVGAGTAGLFSAAQLGTFVITTWAAGRYLEASRRRFVVALLILAVANLASVLVDVFALFVVIRAGSGVALGMLTWLAWSQVFGNDNSQGDLAVIGPLTGVVAAPLFGVLLSVGDDRWVFAVLALASLAPLVAVPDFAVESESSAASRRTRPVPQALALIGGLALATLGGSAVFVFAGVIMADNVGMSSTTVSLVFSANALASIPAARWRGPRPFAGGWLVGAAVCAVLLGSITDPWMSFPVLMVWGFCFWVGVPGIYLLLAERSAHPADRAGDAQASMAAGRALGPLLGAAVVSGWSFGWLGLMGGAIMAAGGACCLVVERLGTPVLDAK